MDEIKLSVRGEVDGRKQRVKNRKPAKHLSKVIFKVL